MNGSFRASRVLAGATLHGAAPLGLLIDERRHLRAGPLRPSARSEAQANIQFVQPMCLNRARYEQIRHALHAKVCVIATLVTTLVMASLWWKAAHGEHVSFERWLLGAASGWFVARMFRLGLFAWLSTPCCVSFHAGVIRLSGLGELKPEEVLNWTLARDVEPDTHTRRCMHLEILCRRSGRTARWTMLLTDDDEAQRLQRFLESHLPNSKDTNPATQTFGLRLKQNDESVASPHASHTLKANPVNRLQDQTSKLGGRTFDRT